MEYMGWIAMYKRISKSAENRNVKVRKGQGDMGGNMVRVTRDTGHELMSWWILNDVFCWFICVGYNVVVWICSLFFLCCVKVRTYTRGDTLCEDFISEGNFYDREIKLGKLDKLGNVGFGRQRRRMVTRQESLEYCLKVLNIAKRLR